MDWLIPAAAWTAVIERQVVLETAGYHRQGPFRFQTRDLARHHLLVKAFGTEAGKDSFRPGGLMQEPLPANRRKLLLEVQHPYPPFRNPRHRSHREPPSFRSAIVEYRFLR